jgi:uncharacterized protein
VVIHSDVTVIGAGIAGLSAAVACQQCGLRVAVVERGPDVLDRNRQDAKDVASGVGGAGLFSDGKFSFFPSATELWKLEPKSDLRRAYQWFSEIIRREGLDAPAFPEVLATDAPSGQHAEKRYLSFYMPLASRLGMVGALAAVVGRALHTSVSFQTMSLGATCEVRCHRGEVLELFESSAVIAATGRLGPLALQNLVPSALQTFRRLEIGVRIEQPADEFFLRSAQTLDPKHVWIDPANGREWRTFCCCRDGEVVAVQADDVLSVSGRSDIPPTGRSSVGLHVRLLVSDAANAAWDTFRRSAANHDEPIVEPIAVFLDSTDASPSPLRDLLGPVLAPLLAEGLYRLLADFPQASTNAILHGPAVEGVLNYPAVSANLKVSRLPLWIAGDATGIFRGITAAGVSGYFAGPFRFFFDACISKSVSNLASRERVWKPAVLITRTDQRRRGNINFLASTSFQAAWYHQNGRRVRFMLAAVGSRQPRPWPIDGGLTVPDRFYARRQCPFHRSAQIVAATFARSARSMPVSLTLQCSTVAGRRSRNQPRCWPESRRPRLGHQSGPTPGAEVFHALVQRGFVGRAR